MPDLLWNKVYREVKKLEKQKTEGIYLKGIGNQEKYAIEKEKKNSIGRNMKESSIYIEDMLISRKHAEIVFEENHFYVIDLNSQNGTYINKTKALPFKKYPLRHYDLITFAQKQYRFSSEEAIRIDHSPAIELAWMQVAQKNKICIHIEKSAELLEYQFQILDENKHVHILDFERVSDHSFERLYVDITDLESLHKIVNKRRLVADELADILLKLVKVLEDTERMLLHKNSFILSLHTIFLSKKGEIKLLYVPIHHKISYEESFKKLIAQLMDEVVQYDEALREEIMDVLQMENVQIPDIMEKIIWNERNKRVVSAETPHRKVLSSSPQGFFLSKKQAIKHSFLKVRRLIMTK